jgi:hypothetical protein
MFGLFKKAKPNFAFEGKLDALVADAKQSGVSDGEMMGAMSSHIVSMKRRDLMALEARQNRTDGLHKSGNL